VARHLARNTTSSIDTYIRIDGLLAAPDALAYAIFDISTPEREATPVQVVARTTLDLLTTLVGPGHYATAWVVSATEPLGRHVITWYSTLIADGVEVSWSEHVDVVSSAAIIPTGPLYALISDMRDEGVPASMSDRRVLDKIADASRLLTLWTGRTFVPEYKTVHIDGELSDTLWLNEPIIAIQDVRQGYDLDNLASFLVIESPYYVVYNRHLREGLLSPDDRDMPRIAFVGADGPHARFGGASSGYPASSRPSWGRGEVQRVLITGLWGYTDPDGSPTGGTPRSAVYVTKRMAIRELPKQNSSGAFETRMEGEVKMKRTREQTISWGSASTGGGTSNGRGGGLGGNVNYTGDPSIDSIIEQLCRPIVGAVV
jgi:hypothetical protein